MGSSQYRLAVGQSLSLCLSLGLCNKAMERQSKGQEGGPLFQGQHHSHIWTRRLDSVNDG